MPSIEFNLSGLQLKSALVEELQSMLLPYAAKVMESTPQPDPEKTLHYLGWPHWSVTTADGVQYSGSENSVRPNFAYFEGATAATFRIVTGLYPWMLTGHSESITLNCLAGGWTTVSVSASEDDVRELARATEEVLTQHVVVQPEQWARPFKVFIAYGGGPAWEVVRDYLKRADIEVDAFTEAERVGEVTIDVVSQMVHSASVAVIVMTAADQLQDGTWHARQNVVHEAGFAQAALGVRNTIVLLEEGVTVPSNLANVTYIPFPRGAVHTTERRVVARVLETKADVDNGLTGGGC